MRILKTRHPHEKCEKPCGDAAWLFALLGGGGGTGPPTEKLK